MSEYQTVILEVHMKKQNKYISLVRNSLNRDFRSILKIKVNECWNSQGYKLDGTEELVDIIEDYKINKNQQKYIHTFLMW